MEEYTAINKSLRKRFRRKADAEAEAAEQFQQLQFRFVREGNLPYAALSGLAVARCEKAMDNTTAYVVAVQQAGNYLWKEELDNLHLPGFEENSTEATRVYSMAIQGYLTQKRYALATVLFYQMALALRELGSPSKAVHCLDKTARLVQRQSPHIALRTIDAIVDIQIEQRDYEGCLASLKSVVALAMSIPLMHEQLAFEELCGSSGVTTGLSLQQKCLANAQLSQVLLLILVDRPNEAEEALAGLVPSSTFLETTLLLESLIEACQSENTRDAEDLEGELWPHLNPSQTLMLRLIVDGLRRARASPLK